ncbi:hypothetical protein [Corynebacterium rouxii]|uniref:Uncharacterized protein n=1 Tax=Corynebacterium rouxii TaxID=2719119 RepID=A0A6I8MIV3_9CORY|nr:hypothetical protein [Corynebacterium rouxii]VZH86423.1 hypothetical protein FRC0190_02333 [Corynebacterium rouxii]
MIDINRYTTSREILNESGASDQGKTTPTVSSIVCAETISYTVTATASLGC